MGLERWVRDLYRHGVTVVVASAAGPAYRLPALGHGAFAEAFLRVLTGPSPADPGSLSQLSIQEFEARLRQHVAVLTDRRQEPKLYSPDTETAQSPFLDISSHYRRGSDAE